MTDLKEPLLPTHKSHDVCYRHIVNNRGRAIHQVKGAANIIKRWSGGVNKTAVGMFIIFVLVMCNIMIAVTWVPSENKKSYHSEPRLPEVYIPVIIDSYNEKLQSFIEQIQMIDLFANKYVDYRFNVIILNNETSDDTTSFDDEYKNEIAMNDLWSIKFVYGKYKDSRVKISYVPLSEYFADSPLNNDWRLYPQYTEFLARAVALWDIGGIALSPEILSLRNPLPKYREKVETILKNYRKCFKEPSDFINKKKNNLKDKVVVNNIQDIIRILNNPIGTIESTQYDPTEAEDNLVPVKVVERKYIEKASTEMNSLTVLKNNVIDNQTRELKDNNLHATNMINKQYIRYKRRAILTNLDNKEVLPQQSEPNLEFESIINAAKPSDTDAPKTDIKAPLNSCAPNQITIDLNGKILATRTPCHAFLGSLFNDVPHYEINKNINTFISREVSNFCKGAVSLCDLIY